MKKSKIGHYTARKAGMAINRYGMIRDGDKVLVGVSGGKDSLTLLSILHERKKWLPIDYEVKAIHVITDYDRDADGRRRVLAGFFEGLGCDYEFRRIDIKGNNRLGREDCFWCSWNRRKALFQAAEELGFNKLALGHHKDDLAETILMNLIYKGEISGINPVQELFGGKITMIRPLVFLEEQEIGRYAEEMDFPVLPSKCPLNSLSKRAVVKKVIRELSSGAETDIKKNIMNAPHRIRAEYITQIDEGASLWRRLFGRPGKGGR